MVAAIEHIDTAVLTSLASGLGEAESAALARALEYAATLYAGRVLGTGEPVMAHALGLCEAIAGLRLDVDARMAGMLFAVPEYLPEGRDERAELLANFGGTVTSLVAGITRLNSLRVVTRTASGGLRAGARDAKDPRNVKDAKNVKNVKDKRAAASQTEVLRKMLLAMVEDIRVVLLRLASRTQTLRYLSAALPSAERTVLARETLDIYAPLANRLGVWQLKWELEDLAFRILEPDTYRRIAAMLDERRVEREAFITGAMAIISRELDAAGVKAEISGRPKHIYSIWNKMRLKSLDFSQLYDVRALRVLVDEVKDCYTALGIVHNLWQPIPGEFDDYIARPKQNDYRSLHTAVIGPDGQTLEVQIRTHDMHRHAELGVAAHWRYKEAGTPGRPARAATRGAEAFDDKIAFLRQMLAWRDDIVDSSDWVEQSKRAALDETIYVLTPQGRVLDLPAGATPVDFAYALHTDVGHHCRGAKVNGRMVPLDYRLANGERVEIVTAKTGGPSRDWLNPQLGYISSSRARNKVRQWFNSQDLEQTIAAGRAFLERELQRLGRTDAKLETLAHALGFEQPEDLFAAAGREEIGPRLVQTALSDEEEAPARPLEEVVARKSRADRAGGILVVGVDRLMTQLAKCCKPAPPDRITGFVTRGRGVSIHRANCPSLAQLLARMPERDITSEWGDVGKSAGSGAGMAGRLYSVDILVRSNDRPGLLKDISEVLSREQINVTAVNTLSRQQLASMAFTLEVKDIGQLARALGLIAEVSGVISAVRR